MDYPKRLIEVDLPIKRISAHARREKSIRHGHISTLHIWWGATAAWAGVGRCGSGCALPDQSGCDPRGARVRMKECIRLVL